MPSNPRDNRPNDDKRNGQAPRTNQSGNNRPRHAGPSDDRPQNGRSGPKRSAPSGRSVPQQRSGAKGQPPRRPNPNAQGGARRPEERPQQQFEDIYSSSKGAPKSGGTSAPRRRKPLSTGRKVLNGVVIAVCILFLAAGCGVLYVHGMMTGMYQSASSPESIDLEKLLPSGVTMSEVNDSNFKIPDITDDLHSDENVTNILLVGADSDTNSDTMMLLSIDNVHQKLKVTSFLRDTFVRIPADGNTFYGKLNASYNAGGVGLVINTLERNFGINIDRYAQVDFNSFRNIIGILGGIEVTINDEEAAYINEYAYDPNILPGGGTYLLSDRQALCHARNRSTGNHYDFGRTERQRDVIRATLNKFKDETDIFKLLRIATSVMPQVKTDLSVDEIKGLALNAQTYLKYEMMEFRLPTDDNFTDVTDPTYGAILQINDFEKAREDIKEFIYGDSVPEGTMPSGTLRDN